MFPSRKVGLQCDYEAWATESAVHDGRKEELVRKRSSHYSCLTSCRDAVISSMKKAHRYIGLYNVPDMRAEIVHGYPLSMEVSGNVPRLSRGGG